MVVSCIRARAYACPWIGASLALLLPGLAMAQPAPRSGAAARPEAGIAGPGLAPLRTEPGDVWGEVRGWTEGRGRGDRPQRRVEEATTGGGSMSGQSAEPGSCLSGRSADGPGCDRRATRRGGRDKR